jgi:N-acetylmuramoyl-L-alanine amidase
VRKINSIIIHCAATPPSMDIGRTEIDQWHTARGWRGIGYHYVIRRSGEIEIGRPVEQVGAHASGHNADSIAICLVGGVDHERKPDSNFTKEQFASLKGLVLDLKGRFPDADVFGHRDIQGVAKACPSFDVRAWWAGRV